TRMPALLSRNQKVCNSVLAECKPLMVSLGNIEEQLRAFQKIKIANTSLHTFPDLHQRPPFKLLQGSRHNSVRDAISNQVSGAFLLYEQNLDTLATYTQRSAVAPSITAYCRGRLDAETHHFRVWFLRRKNVLQTLRADDPCLLETAPKRHLGP
uniref:Uncharacterized protein n=1 Tax=Oncorhynchus tshawytscha TaxID=74940 RepID=A0A8C8D3D6_ONCTS